MLPDAAYPAPLPLSRAAALDLLDRLADFESVRGTFLVFAELPVEERIGEWRFAGVGESLPDAVRLVGEFYDTMGMDDPHALLRVLFERNQDTGYDHEYSYPRDSPRDINCPHRLVFAVRFGAPYEGLGAAVVEVECVAASAFADVAPETHPPESASDEPDYDGEGGAGGAGGA